MRFYNIQARFNLSGQREGLLGSTSTGEDARIVEASVGNFARRLNGGSCLESLESARRMYSPFVHAGILECTKF